MMREMSLPQAVDPCKASAVVFTSMLVPGRPQVVQLPCQLALHRLVVALMFPSAPAVPRQAGQCSCLLGQQQTGLAAAWCLRPHRAPQAPDPRHCRAVAQLQAPQMPGPQLWLQGMAQLN